MLDGLDRKRFAAGDVIFQKGEAGDCAYLIEDGQVEVLDPDTGSVLARIGQGELIGEIALIDRHPRTATATAVEASVLIEIKCDLVAQLLVNTDPIIRHLLNVVLSRFRNNLAPGPDGGRSVVASAVRLPDPLQITAAHKLTLLRDMSFALTSSQFVLYYQPIYRLKDHAVAGFEALIRWNHPKLGLVPPMDFLGLAEETGLIKQIGLWVLEQACKDWSQLRTLTTTEKPFVSVNVSAAQLTDGQFADQAIRSQKHWGIHPAQIKLELTESALILSPVMAQEQLKRLTDFGNSIALDDYGTGFSGLEHLQNYRFHTLKLDQRFIREMLNSSLSFQLVMSSLDMTKSLQIDVVAEGIETEELARILRDLGCEYGQGYLFGKPMALSALLELAEV